MQCVKNQAVLFRGDPETAAKRTHTFSTAATRMMVDVLLETFTVLAVQATGALAASAMRAGGVVERKLTSSEREYGYCTEVAPRR